MKRRRDYLDNLVINYLKSKKLKIAVSDVENCSINEFKKKVLNYKKRLEKIWNKGTKKNRGVAILLDRNADYIAIIFAAWLTKGFYLPLSLTSPKKNIDYQLKNSGVTALVYQKKNKTHFSTLKSKNINTPKLITNNYKKIAYIIFTSGSTGEKKGVCISRENLISYFKAINTIFRKKFNSKSVLINGELTFDISSADLVFALLFKCEIVLTNDPRNLLSFFHKLEERKAESIYVVPSTLEKLTDFLNKYKNINLRYVKQLNCGGEILPYDLLKKIKPKIPNAKIYNFYGPTEFTINSTFFEVRFKKSQKKIIPIGKLLPGNKYFLKKNKKNTSTGELYLSGKQKMLGYVNYLDPTIQINKKNFYPTGDIVSLDKNKNFIFCGREKDYIKVSGYRVNLIRVENLIRKNINLPSVIVEHKRKIILFLKRGNLKERIILKKLKRIFLNKLERYETPFQTVFLKDLPLNINGKIDKKRLIQKLR